MTRSEAMDVYKDRSAKFINTQSIQWKMNLSIWTLLAVAVYYNDKMRFPEWDIGCLTDGHLFEILIGMILMVVHGSFCYKVQWSLDSDKAVKDDITKQLNQSSRNDVNILVDLGKSPSKFRGWQWIFIQTGITLALVLIFCFSY